MKMVYALVCRTRKCYRRHFLYLKPIYAVFPVVIRRCIRCIWGPFEAVPQRSEVLSSKYSRTLFALSTRLHPQINETGQRAASIPERCSSDLGPERWHAGGWGGGVLPQAVTASSNHWRNWNFSLRCLVGGCLDEASRAGGEDKAFAGGGIWMHVPWCAWLWCQCGRPSGTETYTLFLSCNLTCGLDSFLLLLPLSSSSSCCRWWKINYRDCLDDD